MESGKQERFSGSRQMALRRFQNLERKLQTNPALSHAYSVFVNDYESLGHMSVAPSPGDYFIPHNPVFKDYVASKIRVVFDASPTTSSKRSLNQCLFTDFSRISLISCSNFVYINSPLPPIFVKCIGKYLYFHNIKISAFLLACVTVGRT